MVASVPNEGVAGLGGHLAVAVVGIGFVASGSRGVHGVEGAGFGSAVQRFRGGIADEIEAPATGLDAVVLRVQTVHGVEGGVPRIESHRAAALFGGDVFVGVVRVVEAELGLVSNGDRGDQIVGAGVAARGVQAVAVGAGGFAAGGVVIKRSNQARHGGRGSQGDGSELTTVGEAAGFHGEALGAAGEEAVGGIIGEVHGFGKASDGLGQGDAATDGVVGVADQSVGVVGSDRARGEVIGEGVGGFGDAGTGGEVVAAEEARGEVVGHDGAVAAGVDDLDLAAEGVEDGLIDRGVGVDGLDQLAAGVELVARDFAELVGDGCALAFGIVGEGDDASGALGGSNEAIAEVVAIAGDSALGVDLSEHRAGGVVAGEAGLAFGLFLGVGAGSAAIQGVVGAILAVVEGIAGLNQVAVGVEEGGRAVAGGINGDAGASCGVGARLVGVAECVGLAGLEEAGDHDIISCSRPSDRLVVGAELSLDQSAACAVLDDHGFLAGWVGDQCGRSIG